MNWFHHASTLRLRGLHVSGRFGSWRGRWLRHRHPWTRGSSSWSVDPELLSLAFFAILVALTFLV